jgi:hypothetical protein
MLALLQRGMDSREIQSAMGVGADRGERPDA